MYPFSAIVGQDSAKCALKISLVNPRAGGLLISGPKGTAKSTLVRAAAPFTTTGRIVELPLGATEDMVFGSLDIEAALTTGERRHRPGLLHRAQNTILYMDEVNLLRGDFLTAVLDSAANGFFELQREGISRREEVSYTALGTMNPEEGVLTPAILDRFGLFVSLENEGDAANRREIVRRILRFERDGAAMVQRYGEEEERERNSIAAARKLLPSVEASDAILNLTAQYCAQAYCRGNRAELYLLEAARALAALAGRDYVLPKDIEAAAMFVLPHRMGEPPQPPAAPEEPQSSDEMDQNDDDPSNDDMDDDDGEAMEGDAPPPEKQEDGSEEGSDGEKDDGEKEPQQQEEEEESSAGGSDQVFAALENLRAAFVIDPSIKQQKREGSGKRHLTRTDRQSGRYVRAELPRPSGTLDLAFDATLRAAAPHQRYRQGSQAVIIRSEDYRVRVREKRVGTNIIFLVDASGSMGAEMRMKTVKGVILSLLTEAYQKRDRVAFIAFRRDRAEVLLPMTRSVDLAEKRLKELPTGGKTPLAEGLESALGMIYGLERGSRGQQTVLVLVTDGRPNATYAKDDPVARALEAADRFNRTKTLSVVLDTENDFLKLGIAPELARRMGASYYTLKRLSAEGVLRIVQSIQSDVG